MITTSGKVGHPKFPVWTMQSALELVRALQPMLHEVRHHIALGGGVLNKGKSFKDLDLYVLPMGGPRTPISTDNAAVDAVLCDVMDYEAPIGDSETYGDRQQPAMRARDRYTFEGKRVDVFVVRGQR